MIRSKVMKWVAGVAGSIGLLSLSLVVFCFSFGGCSSSPDKANENYTSECHKLIGTLVDLAIEIKKSDKEYAEMVIFQAGNANCLCQQAGKKSDQNLCKGSQRTVIADRIARACRFHITPFRVNGEIVRPLFTSIGECERYYGKDWN